MFFVRVNLVSCWLQNLNTNSLLCSFIYQHIYRRKTVGCNLLRQL